MVPDDQSEPRLPTVSCVACPSYDPALLEPALRRCVEQAGGLGFIRPGDRVFCKLNLLMPAPAERAITTHPELLRAAVRLVREAGGVPVVGDNPAVTGGRIAMRRSGILRVVQEEGLEVADMRPVLRIENARARAYGHFEVSRAVVEAEHLLNLPKLKTHNLCHMTLALKNLFGLIPGLNKAHWHLRAPSPEEFSTLVADLYGAVQQAFAGRGQLFHVLDGVLALEGEGPGMSGKPRQAGLLLASRDGAALDLAACHLAGVEAARVPTTRIAAELQLGPESVQELELLGDDPQELRLQDFQQPPGPAPGMGLLSIPWLRNRLVERPIVQRQRCTSCGQCARICPADTIHIAKEPKKACIEHKACIRCYCCAEICPEAAIEKSSTPLLGRLLLSGRARGLALLFTLGALLALLSLPWLLMR